MVLKKKPNSYTTVTARGEYRRRNKARPKVLDTAGRQAVKAYKKRKSKKK